MKVQGEQPQNSRRILIGVILLVCVGLGAVAFSKSDDVKYNLRRANNILRSWSCPPGGYAAGRQSNGNCLCLRCPKGHKCAGGNHPKQPCRPGNYQDVTGQNACKKAPPGTHVPGSGAKKPTPCGYGTYNNGVGKRACTRASPGHHVPRKGARKQTACAVGTFQDLVGQKLCKPARPGTYVDKTGQRSPTQCNFGTYQPATGKTSCRQASPGHYVPTRGAKQQTPCGVNTAQHCTGQTRCIPCEAPLVAGRGATKCTPPATSSVGKCARPPRCVFPFVYQGVTYHACSTANWGNKLWCSFDKKYRGKWTSCGKCRVHIKTSCTRCARNRPIRVTFAFPSGAGVVSNGWIGIIPRGVASKKEVDNDKRDVNFFHVGSKLSGSGILRYGRPGQYDIKAFTSDNGAVGAQIGQSIPITIV